MPFSRAEIVVEAIELRGQGIPESIRLERSEASVAIWHRPGGQLVPASHVRSLLDELSALVVGDVRANEVDVSLLAKPRLWVRLERSDGEPWEAFFGEEDGEGSVLAARHAEDWLVGLPGGAVNRVIDSARRLGNE